MTQIDFLTLLPHLVLLVWASLLLLVGVFLPERNKGWVPLLAALGLAASLAVQLTQLGKTASAFGGMVVMDGFGVFLNILFLLSGLAAVAIARDYLRRMSIDRPEYYTLLLFSISGMMLMSFAGDLIMVFLALELLSIPLYVLAGFAVPRPESEEAGLKYFLLGAFASGFVLYGTSLIYGATGATSLAKIAAAVTAGTAVPGLMAAGAGLLLVGFGFKTALVPFQMWTPDVYQGAPTPVSGFMSVGAKGAGFAALVRVFSLIFPQLAGQIAPLLAVFAGLTMVIGNVVAVSQTNLKRLLAYSSIAHAGYLLMAFVSYGPGMAGREGIAAVLFYLFSYGLTSLGAWAVVSALEQPDGKGLLLEDLAGLGKKAPLPAAAMAVFMLTFTGIPPMLGFWGKLYLFRTAIEGGYLWLAILGLLTSLVSAWYYLRVIVMMYMHLGKPQISTEFWVTLTTLACAAALIVLGLIPSHLFNWALVSLLGM